MCHSVLLSGELSKNCARFFQIDEIKGGLQHCSVPWVPRLGLAKKGTPLGLAKNGTPGPPYLRHFGSPVIDAW